MAKEKTVVADQKRIHQLEPGMVLARPVYGPGGCPLLHKDKPLTRKGIERLRRHNKRFAYVYLPGYEPEVKETA